MVWFSWWAVFSRMEEKPSQLLVYDTSWTYLKGSEIWLKRKSNSQNISSDPLADKCLNKPLIFHHGPLHPWWREFQFTTPGFNLDILYQHILVFCPTNWSLPLIWHHTVGPQPPTGFPPYQGIRSTPGDLPPAGGLLMEAFHRPSGFT